MVRVILRHRDLQVSHAIHEPISRSIFYFLSILLVLEKKFFLLSLYLFEFTRTMFSSLLSTPLIWITSTKCSIPFKKFLKDFHFVARC